MVGVVGLLGEIGIRGLFPTRSTPTTIKIFSAGFIEGKPGNVSVYPKFIDL